MTTRGRHGHCCRRCFTVVLDVRDGVHIKTKTLVGGRNERANENFRNVRRHSVFDDECETNYCKRNRALGYKIKTLYNIQNPRVVHERRHRIDKF